MIQNAAEGKKDVRSVNGGQGCFNTELRIVGEGNSSTNWPQLFKSWIALFMHWINHYPADSAVCFVN